jgi:uncharacterized membrane protein YqjE
MSDNNTSDLGRALQELTQKAQLLVHEEVELAKAELTEKATKLGKGAAVGAVGGVFAFFGLIFLLHALAWGLWLLIDGGDNIWLGFLIVAVLLFIVGAIAAVLAMRFIKSGSPPKPTMAIEEAQLIKETVTHARGSGPMPPVTPARPPVHDRPEVRS